MIVNAAIFTCSICGESSTDICVYCTKDTCANHRCQRCKRCSDCCECEIPLSNDEPMPVEEPAAAEIVEHPAAETVSTVADFLTPEEASVFAAEPEIPQPIFRSSNVFVEPEHSADAAAPAEDVSDSETSDAEPEAEDQEHSADTSDEPDENLNGDGDHHPI